jgi:hypothetical protein
MLKSFRGLRKFFRSRASLENRDLLAPRRQERQVQNWFPLAAFAPLREIFRFSVAALPRWALRGEMILTTKDRPKRDPPQADQADTKVSKEDNKPLH